MIAYTTAQRTAEFGVRIALGAQPRGVLQLVMRRGLKLVFAGIVIGSGAALLLARVFRSIDMYHTGAFKARDPLAFLAALIVIVLAALLAMLLPALRASKVEPMSALRYE